MMQKDIIKNLTEGEGLNVEFKEARDHLPENLFETICAFLNTEGGTIWLSVRDDGTVAGVNPVRMQDGRVGYSVDDMFVTNVYPDELTAETTPQVTPQVTPQATPQVNRKTTQKTNRKTTQKTTRKTTRKTTQKTIRKSLAEILLFDEENNMEQINNYINHKLGNSWEIIKTKLGENGEKVGRKQGESWEKTKISLGENQLKIIALLLADNTFTIDRIATALHLSTTAVEKNIAKLKQKKILRRIGPDKGGYWKILNQ